MRWSVWRCLERGSAILEGLIRVEGLRTIMALWEGVKGVWYDPVPARLSVGEILALDFVRRVMRLAHPNGMGNA